MNSTILSLLGLLYTVLTAGGLVRSGLPVAYWKGVIQPAFLGTLAGTEKRRSPLIVRLASVTGLAIFFILLAIVFSPLSVYRCVWELWRWVTGAGPHGPCPPKEPAVAKRAKAA